MDPSYVKQLEHDNAGLRAQLFPGIQQAHALAGSAQIAATAQGHLASQSPLIMLQPGPRMYQGQPLYYNLSANGTSPTMFSTNLQSPLAPTGIHSSGWSSLTPSDHSAPMLFSNVERGAEHISSLTISDESIQQRGPENTKSHKLIVSETDVDGKAANKYATSVESQELAIPTETQLRERLATMVATIYGKRGEEVDRAMSAFFASLNGSKPEPPAEQNPAAKTREGEIEYMTKPGSAEKHMEADNHRTETQLAKGIEVVIPQAVRTSIKVEEPKRRAHKPMDAGHSTVTSEYASQGYGSNGEVTEPKHSASRESNADNSTVVSENADTGENFNVTITTQTVNAEAAGKHVIVNTTKSLAAKPSDEPLHPHLMKMNGGANTPANSNNVRMGLRVPNGRFQASKTDQPEEDEPQSNKNHKVPQDVEAETFTKQSDSMPDKGKLVADGGRSIASTSSANQKIEQTSEQMTGIPLGAEQIVSDYVRIMQRPSGRQKAQIAGGTKAGEDECEDLSQKIILWQNMDDENPAKVVNEEIEVRHDALKLLLVEIDQSWRDAESVDNSRPITWDEPFTILVRRWDEYVSATTPAESDSASKKEARAALSALLQALTRSVALGPYLRSRDAIIRHKRIKFQFLWTIFPHGTSVYAQSYRKSWQMFQVCNTSDPPLKKKKPFRITCVGFDWDGSNFMPYQYNFYIKSFGGEIPISTLDVCPLEYFTSKDGTTAEVHRNLVERGKKYLEFTVHGDFVKCGYEGDVAVNRSPLCGSVLTSIRVRRALEDVRNGNEHVFDIPELDIGLQRISGMQTGVIIDHYSFLYSKRNGNHDTLDGAPLWKKIPETYTECSCLWCEDSNIRKWLAVSVVDKSVKAIHEAFKEHEDLLALLPPRLLGYALHDKIWGQFHVDQLQLLPTETEQQRKTLFTDYLQIKREDKEILLAYVENYGRLRSTEQRRDPDGSTKGAFDIIEGKGEGLVVLLHGPPGVGKTLTAETIAYATGRPLYPITIADIGIDSGSAEGNLSKVFSNAARWGAVLLMDEADIFVETRGKNNLERNALVAVFLRALEYYRGIIILTTNRVTSIDAAMLSRVDVALCFRDLTDEQRLQIYKDWIRRINEDEREPALLHELENAGLCYSQPNGRSIRNIVNGARALARRDNTKVGLTHLRKADKITVSFTQSMLRETQKQRDKNEVYYEE